ncbi:DUF4446 family protein [Peptoniphilaceae bacterium SGI.131]
MTTLEIILSVIVALLTIVILFRLGNLNFKLKNMKKRYDYLLRGRGDLNMEELLRAHSKDIDIAIKKLKSLEDGFSELSEAKESADKFMNNKIEDQIMNNQNLFNKKISGEVSRLEKIIKEENARLHDDFLNKSQKLNAIVNNSNSKLESAITSNEKKFTDMYNDLDSKYTNEILNINKDRKTIYKKIEERHEVDLDAFDKRLEENIGIMNNKLTLELKAINDKLSMAIQNVALHKYNAFDNQTGELSFTLVFLDRFNNGIMFTSINGRDGAYTYSKEIKNGKSLQDLSPEEVEALSMVVKK